MSRKTPYPGKITTKEEIEEQRKKAHIFATTIQAIVTLIVGQGAICLFEYCSRPIESEPNIDKMFKPKSVISNTAMSRLETGLNPFFLPDTLQQPRSDQLTQYKLGVYHSSYQW